MRTSQTSEKIKESKKGLKRKSTKELEDEEARERYKELMKNLGDYRQQICYEPMGYVPNGRKRKDS